MFLCFNAQLNRQFEFIQQNWIQNTRFHGLRDESDPLLGTTRQFTMPGLPVGERVILPKERPVAMLGGGYFFFPGKAALHYLAHLNTRQMPVT